mmetsp:Transcript_54370/g.140441  ORF Transcript_54370/g.140441 Transcript_54370/m.140441 type:complete len:613 (+) Transcript_54370:41-1879(+)
MCAVVWTLAALCWAPGTTLSFSPLPLSQTPTHSRQRLPRILLFDKEKARKQEEMRDVWEYREDFARGAFEGLVNFKEDERQRMGKRAERRQDGASADAEATKSAFAASAAAVLVGALVLRLGGRAALVSVLGLDIVADLGIGDQIDQVLALANDAGGLTVVAFILAWIVAKVFLIDIIAIALAFSSGILFGGVIEGALVSAVGATLGSLTAFGLSRTLLQERVEGFISKRPVARGLAKVVEADGFKTVFVLRLSPILPIPTGAYPYIYGTSKLNPLTFASGYFLGSMKPYLLDSYLGVFSKQILDGESLDSSKDLLLLVGLGALVLVGVFATELANESWDLVQQEVKADKERVAELEASGQLELQTEEDAVWDGMIGPLNTTAISEAVISTIPADAREESTEVWRMLNEFCDDQWRPALQRTLRERQADKERQARIDEVLKDMKEGKYVERALLSTLSQEPKKVVELPPTTADFARRNRMSEWSLEEGKRPWRELLSTTLFSFALASSARGKWVDYPLTEDELKLAAAEAEAGVEIVQTESSDVVAPVIAPVLATTAVSVLPPTTCTSTPPSRSEEELVRELADTERRLAEVDEKLKRVLAAEEALRGGSSD